MPQFTYDGFINAASNAGLLGEFSQADLDTAKKYPEFGYSILGLKQDIHKATTPEAKLLAFQSTLPVWGATAKLHKYFLKFYRI